MNVSIFYMIGRQPGDDRPGAGLKQQGHSLDRSGAAKSTVDLIIDDGFIAAGDFCAIPHLHLRLGVGEQSNAELPSLDLLCFLGSSLISRVPIGDEPSGNGQALRQRVLMHVVDEVSLLVSRYSRDPEYLRHAAAVTAPGFRATGKPAVSRTALPTFIAITPPRIRSC